MLAILGSRAAAQPVDHTEASLRMLRHAVTAQRDGRNLSLLFALRQLRDPALAPLFSRLVEHSQWQVQVHAVLGLGEISDAKRIDESLLPRVATQAQNAIIATALDLSLMSGEQLGKCLHIENLSALTRVMILAELLLLGQQPDRQTLINLTQSTDDHVAGLAICLLAQSGEADRIAEYRSRIDSLEARRRSELQLWLVEAIRRYKLQTCATWLAEMAERSPIDSELARRGMFALLQLEHERGLALLNRHLSENPSYQQRVRYCMLVLASGGHVPIEIYNRFNPQPDEDLLLKMVAVGRAIASKSDLTPAMIALLDLGHPRTNEWALEHLAKMPQTQAAPAYGHLIDRLPRQGNAEGDAIAHAVIAAAKLHQIDSSAVLQRLRNAEDDSLAQQAILLGLFEVHAPEIGEAAASLRRIGSGRADSLATLLMAKNLPTLQRSEVEQLGKIAAGGGRVSEILQMQAAWLFLKHTGQIDTALNALFADQ